MTRGIGERGEFKDGRWALVDAEGNALTEYKYWFVEPCGEGYFRAQVTGGSKYNLLRPDGTEIFRESFSFITEVHGGYVTFWNTKRKTKTTPTQYLYGVGHVSGVILFPPIFKRLRWLKEDVFDAFYAELDGKPYVLTLDGSAFDPERSHLPKKLDIDIKLFFEKFANWVLPGLQFFYRDTDAPVVIDTTYHVCDVIRAGFFVDATTKLLKPAHKTRFLIASAHAAMFCDSPEMTASNPDIKKWNLCTFHFNSYFKVMDIYKVGEVTQIFLLHIPETAARLMGNTDFGMQFINGAMGGEQTLVDIARRSLDDKMRMDVHPRSYDKVFVQRMEHPVGLDNDFYPVPLDPMAEPKDNDLALLSSAVHRLAQDADIDGIFKEEENFTWNGPEGTVCEGCIYTRGIREAADGCGRLFKKTFRDNVIKGHCDFRKTDLFLPSEFEKKKKREYEAERLRKSKEDGTFAQTLLQDFIKQKLHGNIEELKSYDFSELHDWISGTPKEDEKFADCGGYAFSPDKTEIVKAIMSLVFKDAWPGYSYESMEKLKYQVDRVNHFTWLFGSWISPEYIKGLDKFSPPKQLLARVNRFHKQYNTIGNFFVLPNMITLNFTEANVTRGKRLWRPYIDTFMVALRQTLLDWKSGERALLDLINDDRKAYKDCQTDEGFTRMMRNLMLDDIMDDDGRPMKIFAGIGCGDRDLDRITYLKVANEYLDFCDSFISRRADRIIRKLKEIIK